MWETDVVQSQFGHVTLGKTEEISIFTYKFGCSPNFIPGDEVIGDSFQPFLFEVCLWPPDMPRLQDLYAGYYRIDLSNFGGEVGNIRLHTGKYRRRRTHVIVEDALRPHLPFTCKGA
ncbi:hypothetical protein AVEN_216241-1 [Araneus ventricosus]|uniref:Uncharacterized protein n=1 Tax=Araneus ventricosus TaxID=182803 RepID=A0A4Y2S7H9_ARAVE|nr:hypothetical protein AVEN_216241-1 [Araneus ventricosus]